MQLKKITFFNIEFDEDKMSKAMILSGTEVTIHDLRPTAQSPYYYSYSKSQNGNWKVFPGL